MPTSLASLALPAIVAAVLVARIYVRRAGRLKDIGAVPPGRKVVVLNLLDRNR